MSLLNQTNIFLIIGEQSAGKIITNQIREINKILDLNMSFKIQEQNIQSLFFNFTDKEYFHFQTVIHFQEADGFVYCFSLQNENRDEEVIERILKDFKSIDSYWFEWIGNKSWIMNKEYPILFFVTDYNSKQSFIKAKFLSIKKKLELQYLCQVQEIEQAANNLSIQKNIQEYQLKVIVNKLL